MEAEGAATSADGGAASEDVGAAIEQGGAAMADVRATKQAARMGMCKVLDG
jgi:hypothetical protein